VWVAGKTVLLFKHGPYLSALEIGIMKITSFIIVLVLKSNENMET